MSWCWLLATYAGFIVLVFISDLTWIDECKRGDWLRALNNLPDYCWRDGKFFYSLEGIDDYK